MPGPAEDWIAIVERLLDGDRLAFLKVNRLVTGCLTQLRAYEFEEEWDDLRQEVVIAIVANARAGRLRDPQAFVGYVRAITRNKVMDRLSRKLGRGEKEAVPWDDATAAAAASPPAADPPIDRIALQAALAALPEEEREVVTGVYAEGKTYEQVSADTGIPLGTMKRRLRDGLHALRRRLDGG